MSDRYKVRDERQLYFLSFATVNWVDVFTRRLYCDIVIDSLRYCTGHKGLELYAYCIMTNHVHLIVGSETGRLTGIIRDLKRHTSKELLRAIADNQQESRRAWLLWMFARAGQHKAGNEQYQFWQAGSHPVELGTNFLRRQKLEYVHRNPVEAGFVALPEEFLYSSARNYAGQPGLLPVLLIQ
ncbi:transposase [Hymenobacter gummosus]|uniref:Transposase n=1 Tax=Hymenobacter gummosus TaxID=1776032 RepID=A0A431TV34_9BACT|nr:transposase [Hymenobacter gummosus]RTQ45228.1 transposase [Hymenobacter gummosus]